MQWAEIVKELKEMLPIREEALLVKANHLEGDASVVNDGRIKELRMIMTYLEHLEVRHA